MWATMIEWMRGWAGTAEDIGVSSTIPRFLHRAPGGRRSHPGDEEPEVSGRRPVDQVLELRAAPASLRNSETSRWKCVVGRRHRACGSEER